MDKIIAITGGIGSGKSTAIEILKNKGYKVLSADETYKSLLSDSAFVKAIHNLLGIESNSLVLEREKVSKIVFSDSKMHKKLNEFTHTKIVLKMLEESKNQGVVFHEVPLLFEGGFEKYYSKIIVITRDFEQRVNSVIKRNALTRDEVLKRISSQVDYDKINLNGYIVVENNKGVLELQNKLEKILLKI